MPERFQLPPVITSSSWITLMQSLWSQSRRGTVKDDAGIEVPAWTNREAIAIISGMRELAQGMPTGQGFPLWYQFAAVAYGWQPQADTLDNSTAQADRIFPPDDAVELNAELERMVTHLDLRSHPAPRMALVDRFGSDTFLSELRTALRQDGAEPQFKIPLPACKDPATGRPARPVKDPRTGKWACPGGAITIDDPVTALLKALATVAVPAALVLLAIGALEPRRRRRKNKR